MNKLLTFVLLVTLLTLFVSQVEAVGGYWGSCSECTIDRFRARLSCNCKKPDGGNQRSDLDLELCISKHKLTSICLTSIESC